MAGLKEKIRDKRVIILALQASNVYLVVVVLEKHALATLKKGGRRAFSPPLEGDEPRSETPLQAKFITDEIEILQLITA